MNCIVEDCKREAAPNRGGKCWAHAKRQTRQKPLSEPVREYGLPPAVHLGRVAIRYANAGDDDAEFNRARVLLLMYARLLGRAKKIVPSRPQTSP